MQYLALAPFFSSHLKYMYETKDFIPRRMYSSTTYYFSKHLNVLLQGYGIKQEKNSWSRSNMNSEVCFPCAFRFLKKDFR